MSFSVVGFQVSFEKTQGINPGATALAKGGALFGRTHRHFPKHRRE
jgi:hypothetical protein